MKNYVQYHSVEKMGYLADPFENGEFGISTNKSVSGLIGSRIWLVTGEASPRIYALAEVFIVDKVRDSDDPTFTYALSGHQGTHFVPTIPLNKLSWFRELLKSQQNFRFGFNELVNVSIVAELASVAENYRHFREHADRLGYENLSNGKLSLNNHSPLSREHTKEAKVSGLTYERDRPNFEKDSMTSQFSKIILITLKTKSATTSELYQIAKSQVPTLCDDSIPCEHGGGSEWQHILRGAQNILSKDGQICRTRDKKAWQLARR